MLYYIEFKRKHLLIRMFDKLKDMSVGNVHLIHIPLWNLCIYNVYIFFLLQSLRSSCVYIMHLSIVWPTPWTQGVVSHLSNVSRILLYHDAHMRQNYDELQATNDGTLSQNYDAPVVDFDCHFDAHPTWSKWYRTCFSRFAQQNQWRLVSDGTFNHISAATVGGCSTQISGRNELAPILLGDSKLKFRFDEQVDIFFLKVKCQNNESLTNTKIFGGKFADSAFWLD